MFFLTRLKFPVYISVKRKPTKLRILINYTTVLQFLIKLVLKIFRFKLLAAILNVKFKLI